MVLNQSFSAAHRKLAIFCEENSQKNQMQLINLTQLLSGIKITLNSSNFEKKSQIENN